MQFAVIAENDESQWHDETGVRYHFPKRYAKLLPPGTAVVYYKGRIKSDAFADKRLSKDPHYFGLATIAQVSPDPASTKGDFFATIDDFAPFTAAVPAKDRDEFLERIPQNRITNYWRDGVRAISKDVYDAILSAAVSANAVAFGPKFDILPTEEATPAKFLEGATRTVSVNAYERNPKARQACLDHFGFNCAACGFNFSKVYGAIGDRFIHVHHLRDIASVGTEYEVNPITDLRPVCPNCHAMLHVVTPAMSIERLQEIMAQAKTADGN